MKKYIKSARSSLNSADVRAEIDYLSAHISRYGTRTSPEKILDMLSSYDSTLSLKQLVLFAKLLTDGDYRSPRGYTQPDVDNAVDAFLFVHRNRQLPPHIIIGEGNQRRLSEMVVRAFQDNGYDAECDAGFGGPYVWVVALASNTGAVAHVYDNTWKWG